MKKPSARFRFNTVEPWVVEGDHGAPPGEALAHEIGDALVAAGIRCSEPDMDSVCWFFPAFPDGERVFIEVLGEREGTNDGFVTCDGLYSLIDLLARRSRPGAGFTKVAAIIERTLQSSSAVRDVRAVTGDEFFSVTSRWDD